MSASILIIFFYSDNIFYFINVINIYGAVLTEKAGGKK